MSSLGSFTHLIYHWKEANQNFPSFAPNCLGTTLQGLIQESISNYIITRYGGSTDLNDAALSRTAHGILTHRLKTLSSLYILPRRGQT